MWVFFKTQVALAEWPNWLEHPPIHGKVVGSVPRQGTYRFPVLSSLKVCPGGNGLMFLSQICFLSLCLSLPLTLKISKYILSTDHFLNRYKYLWNRAGVFWQQCDVEEPYLGTNWVLCTAVRAEKTPTHSPAAHLQLWFSRSGHQPQTEGTDLRRRAQTSGSWHRLQRAQTSEEGHRPQMEGTDLRCRGQDFA